MTKNGITNIDKRTIRLLLLVFVIVWISGIHSLASSIGLDEKSSPVDIGIFNTGCGDFEIRAKPLTNLTGTTVTNIQFTVRWPANTVNFFNFTSSLLFKSTGTGVSIGWIIAMQYLLLLPRYPSTGLLEMNMSC